MSWETEIAAEYSLSAEQISRFQLLLKELSGVSDRNLTAVTSDAEIVDFHFRDSLSLLPLREFDEAEKIVDVGSGAGFPGLPLAIARPEKSFSLMEAKSRKCKFIDRTVELLHLENVCSLQARAEEAGRAEYRDSFDLAVARAVGSMALVLEYVLPLLKPGGYALLQRGAREDGDESSTSAIARQLGGRLERVEPANPFAGSKNLHIWVISKVSPTPDRFPRRTGIARKRPLSP